MKRLFTFILLACAFCQIYAQNAQVKITLKSGVVVKGDLKELNPTEFVIISIAGVDSKISMENIASIENLNSKPSNDKNDELLDVFDSRQIGKYQITDKTSLPESFNLDLGGQTIKMILVRGGVFNMGYDGDGSLGMKSEPVHQVTLSSYYISETCINERTAYKLLQKKRKFKDRYYSDSWKNANLIMENLAKETGKPYRLLTEAEWEYASLMPNADNLWGIEKYIEWCSDFYSKYTPAIQTNPKGPISGKSHVYRSYRAGKNKWDRKPGHEVVEAYIRIAISASDL